MSELGEGREIEAVVFEAEGLGDRSYLIHDGTVATVVDPQRDPELYRAGADALGVRITHVLDTHIHNDYLSGGHVLSRRTGATYVLPEGEQVDFAAQCRQVGEGAHFETGSMTIVALSTPGHTDHHLSYVLGHASAKSRFVCTGGSVLPGGVGRTDLLGIDRADELATAQWSSARRLLTLLDASTTVLPTHGFGSFCSATTLSAATGAFTVGAEATRNPAMHQSVAEFVEALRRGRPPIPAYYAHMAPLNRRGLDAPRLEGNDVLGWDELERHLRAGTWIVDLRTRREFAAAHVLGTTNFELSANLTTYFGWLVPFEQPYVMIASTREQVLEAQRQLARIGREEIVGYALIDEIAPLATASYPVANFAGLKGEFARGYKPYVLDVRHPSEWQTRHLVGAVHVALPELDRALGDLPLCEEVWVHCGAGFRAAVAASRMTAWGLKPVLVDDAFDNALAAGLEVENSDL